jgi:EmrB/QacA subfamily drug resistance transporter
MNRGRNFFARSVICTGALLSNVSAGMLNVALIDIASEYGRSIDDVQWVITLYLLTITVCLPVMGRLGDLLGKRAVHNAGFLLFTAGALGCALAPGFVSLLAARVVQGVGASMYQATNMALIVSLVSSEHRGRALGIVSTFVAAGAIIGPGLGGVVVQWMTWKANFWILAGIAAALWLAAQLAIPKVRPVSRIPVDAFGAAIFAAGIGSLTVSLNLSGGHGLFAPAPLALTAAFAACAAAFVMWCRSDRWKGSGRMPFIRPDLFKSPTVRLGVFITVVTYMAAFATQIVLPVLLRNELSLPPAWAGAVMAAYPVSLFISAPVSGDLSDRFGSAPMMTLGLGLMAVSLGALSFVGGHSSVAYIVIFVFLLGSSMGMITSPNNSLMMSKTDPSAMSLMSSMIALCRNVGMMFGSVLGGTLVASPSAVLPGEWLNFAADPVLIGYRSVFAAAALCVGVAAVSQILLVRKQMRRGTMSA